MVGFICVLITCIFICLILICYTYIYNIFQTYIIRINEAEAFIDTTLRKRFDLLNKSIGIIKANIDTSGSVKVVNQEGVEVTNNKVGTGYKVVIELSKETIEYTLVVSGDITGDGEIKMSDVMKVATQMIEENTIIGDCYLRAADVTGDGKIRMSDVMKLANMILEGEI